MLPIELHAYFFFFLLLIAMVKRAWPPVRVELSDLSLFYQGLPYGNLPSVKLLSPQVSGSMIAFMAWKYRGEIRDPLSASIREVPVVGETSPKRITWSNVYRSFPLKVLIFIKFWDKLEALSVYVSFFCPFFTVEVLKHGILDSVPALQNYVLYSAESSCSLEYVVLVAGACSRAFVAPGLFSPAVSGSCLAWVTTQWLLHLGSTKCPGLESLCLSVSVFLS